MRDFNRNKSFGKKRDFGNRGGSDRPQLFSATCANCGKACEVPFRPTGSKPVLCRDCFRNDNSSESRRFEGRNSGRSEDRRMYNATCASCGNSCQVPFQPSEGRPVYCSACFDKNDGQESRFDKRPERSERPSFERPTAQPDYKAQLDALNVKVDKILAILSSAMEEAEEMEEELELAEEPVEEVAVAKEVKEKPAKKAKAVKTEEEPKKEKKAPKKKSPSAKEE